MCAPEKRVEMTDQITSKKIFYYPTQNSTQNSTKIFLKKLVNEEKISQKNDEEIIFSPFSSP
jgi:hypothetical protein